MIDFKAQKEKKKNFTTKATTATLKYTNASKKLEVKNIIQEYKNVMQQVIDMIWINDDVILNEKTPTLLTKQHQDNINTWLSARLVQCAGKQACAIIKGTRTKQQRRLFVLNELKEKGHFAKARKLQKKIDNAKISKPTINNVRMELDSRFVKIDFNENTTFDGWITLSSIGLSIKLNIPFNKHKHFNKLLNKGTIKKGIRLSEKDITFIFDIPRTPKKENGQTLGIDIGSNTAYACSNDEMSQKDIHGWDLKGIIKKLSQKKKGSKAFEKATRHRTNYINWAANQIDFGEFYMLRLENIKQMRHKKNCGRKLSHWTYTEIYAKLEDKCLEEGVLLSKISPTYTSIRCSVCGWTRVRNRKRELFKCGQCGFTSNSDLNPILYLSIF